MRAFYLFLIFSFLSTSVFAEQDSILIHKIQVKLGMPKETTIELFSQKYDLQRVEGGQIIGLSSKKDPNLSTWEVSLLKLERSLQPPKT